MFNSGEYFRAEPFPLRLATMLTGEVSPPEHNGHTIYEDEVILQGPDLRCLNLRDALRPPQNKLKSN
jgi:hypothetical protein